MTYNQLVSLSKYDVFDRDQAKRGKFDATKTISEFAEYFSQNEIPYEIKPEGTLEAIFDNTFARIFFKPKGYTGEGIVAINVESKDQAEAVRIRRIIKGIR